MADEVSAQPLEGKQKTSTLTPDVVRKHRSEMSVKEKVTCLLSQDPVTGKKDTDIKEQTTSSTSRSSSSSSSRPSLEEVPSVQEHRVKPSQRQQGKKRPAEEATSSRRVDQRKDRSQQHKQHRSPRPKSSSEASSDVGSDNDLSESDGDADDGADLRRVKEKRTDDPKRASRREGTRPLSAPSRGSSSSASLHSRRDDRKPCSRHRHHHDKKRAVDHDRLHKHHSHHRHHSHRHHHHHHRHHDEDRKGHHSSRHRYHKKAPKRSSSSDDSSSDESSPASSAESDARERALRQEKERRRQLLLRDRSYSPDEDESEVSSVAPRHHHRNHRNRHRHDTDRRDKPSKPHHKAKKRVARSSSSSSSDSGTSDPESTSTSDVEDVTEIVARRQGGGKQSRMRRAEQQSPTRSIRAKREAQAPRTRDVPSKRREHEGGKRTVQRKTEDSSESSSSGSEDTYSESRRPHPSKKADTRTKGSKQLPSRRPGEKSIEAITAERRGGHSKIPPPRIQFTVRYRPKGDIDQVLYVCGSATELGGAVLPERVTMRGTPLERTEFKDHWSSKHVQIISKKPGETLQYLYYVMDEEKGRIIDAESLVAPSERGRGARSMKIPQVTMVGGQYITDFKQIDYQYNNISQPGRLESQRPPSPDSDDSLGF